MPQGAKYYVYPAAILKTIKDYIKLHIYNYYKKGIIKHKRKTKVQAKVALPYTVIALANLHSKGSVSFLILVKDRAILSLDDIHENDIVRGYIKSCTACGVFVG